MDKKCLIVASVSSMIGQFNMPNIDLLLSMGYKITVAANFSFGNTFSNSHAEGLRNILKEKNVEVHDIKFVRNIFSFKNIIAYKQVKQLIEDNNYSLINCHSPIGGVVTRLAANKSRKTGAKVIYTAHGFHFYKGAPLINWLLYYTIEKLLSKYTDTLITINHEDYELAKKKLRAKKMVYTPGIGVDTNKFSKTNIVREAKRKELGIPIDAKVLISVGELNKNKNHQTIIKAVSKIKSDNLYYIICGKGDLNVYLSDLCKQLNIDNRVIFLGYRTDIADLLRMSDIFIFPSLREGLSVSLMEAMAAGLPCVVSKIRGNVDLIEHEKGGFLCNADIADEYVTAIKKIVENVDLCKSMSEHNKTAVQTFSLTVVMEKMKEIYGESLNGI